MSGITFFICSKCGEHKPITEFTKNKNSKHGIRKVCKLCRKEQNNLWLNNNPNYHENYRLNNMGKFRDKSKRYYDKNREEILSKREWGDKEKSYYNEYRRLRKLTDPEYKLIENLRSRTRGLFKGGDDTTCELLGCSKSFLKKYLEEQFTNGMSWDNYGFHGWHIDHKIPLSSAKSEEELKSLIHYTNLQPLWGKDNLRKGKKII
jgi:hypothetical protein